MNYCEVCGVLIAGAPPGVPASICERCFASRKVLVEPDADSSSSQVPADRIQFACPSCKSILQLPPVPKRTKIKCPQCRADFAMEPNGRIESIRASQKLDQERLLTDLKPQRELDDLLARVPEKKSSEALPSVLDSGQYDDIRLANDSGAAGAEPELKLLSQTQRPGPGDAAGKQEPDYILLDDAPGAPESADPVKDGEEPKRKKIQTARRSKDQIYALRKEQEVRAKRAAEAQKYTLALVELRRRRAVATARLAALVAAPLLVGSLFLISTTQEGGFAVRGGLGHALTEIGETARRGVEGVFSLVGAK
jgi:hypothetical protein